MAKCPKPPQENEKSKIKYVFMKKVTVHVTTAKIAMTKRYMYLWHTYLLMTNVLVESSVTVCN